MTKLILGMIPVLLLAACLEQHAAPKPAPIPGTNNANVTSPIYMAHYFHANEAGTLELANVTNLVAELARGGAICAQYGHAIRGGRCPICGQQP
jgi:hypothetical protein